MSQATKQIVDDVLRRLPYWLFMDVSMLVMIALVALYLPVLSSGDSLLMKLLVRSAMSAIAVDHRDPWSEALIIFSNNVRVLLEGAVPFIGAGMMVSLVLVNGWVGRYVALVRAFDWRWWVVSRCFLTPFSYLEFLAYSIGTFASLELTVEILIYGSRIGYLSLIRYAVFVCLAVVVLFVAAVVEAFWG